MGNKSKKPPNRNSSVKVFTRDHQANFDSEASSGSAGSPAKDKCWTFVLVELAVSLDILQVDDPVNANVVSTEVIVYNSDGIRLGKAPSDKGAQISKAGEAESKYALNGKITKKLANTVEVRICF
ncbi:MAG TPA: hypothetical protein VF602_02805 [Pedobacter sp.]